MGLRDRLRKLEDQPEAKRCPKCELLPDGPGYIVIEEGEEAKQEYCPHCGRDLYFFIRVAYEPQR